jgi:hypothetical protein
VTSRELENLANIGQLKRTTSNDTEIDALVRSGEARLKDAGNASLALESRFDLAYNAAHALALAALRRHGYRSENRYVVFQTLPHTLGVATSVWRLLAKCHGLRNQAEYEGGVELDDRIVTDLVAATKAVRDALRRQAKVSND